MADERLDFDSPWKTILEEYLPDFMAFCFPQINAEIDWAQGYTFLDKELQQIVREAAAGRREADKLVRVWRADGTDAWVLVHIEVQNQDVSDFAERMLIYHYRLRDRYQHQPIVSLAVLGDERPSWRPSQYHSALWGCELSFTYPIVKLLDYRASTAALESNPNPFATVVLAHLATQATRDTLSMRAVTKFTLIRRLYERGVERDALIKLFRFIDWIMRLPDDLEDQFWQELQEYEERQHMEYITSVERIGIRKGIEQGIERGIERGMRRGLLVGISALLKLRFGQSGLSLLPEIERLEDVTVLERIHEALLTIATPEALQQIYRAEQP